MTFPAPPGVPSCPHTAPPNITTVFISRRPLVSSVLEVCASEITQYVLLWVWPLSLCFYCV